MPHIIYIIEYDEVGHWPSVSSPTKFPIFDKIENFWEQNVFYDFKWLVQITILNQLYRKYKISVTVSRAYLGKSVVDFIFKVYSSPRNGRTHYYL